MKKLSGKISDRIRSGDLPADVHVTSKVPSADDRPTPDAVRNGSGRALGDPGRSDRSAGTHDR